MKCDDCKKEFTFPDYAEFRHHVYTNPKDSPDNKKQALIALGYTAACPFCGKYINHEHIHHYPDKTAGLV